MEFFQKRYLFLFCIVTVFLIILGFYQTNSNYSTITNSDGRLLGWIDVLYIFVFNSVMFTIWGIFSVVGISVLFVFKFEFSIGQFAAMSDINPFLYLFSSLPHAIGELAVSYIIVFVTIKHLKLIYLFFVNKIEWGDLKSNYLIIIKKWTLIVYPILFISALVEVFISNRLYLYFE